MKKTVQNRPDINSFTSSKELRKWYWRKDELVAHARQIGVKTTGGKFTILDRIAHFLDTGEKIFPKDITRKPKSTFDWHCEVLDLQTKITDSYKNTQNVRRFFKSQLGVGFKFNIEFMAWMKNNVGKTLEDACVEYRQMKVREADPGFKSQIADHNQFNQYTRDFLEDNPELGLADVRKYWALKIAIPSDSGRHEYDPSDLDLP